MQLLKRARNSEMDVIPLGESENNIQDEANLRSYKAGYTDRDGQQMISRNNNAGKGDVSRPCNKALYDKNYERIYGKK